MKKLIYTLFFISFLISCQSAKDESEYPLLETMGYYQRFSDKLWMSGINQNWELANFYAHELEEVTEEFIQVNVDHDGQNLSDIAKVSIEPALEGMEEAIKAKDQVLFLRNYKLITASCNTCHAATGHSFIKIEVPDSTKRFNQQFRPQSSKNSPKPQPQY